MRSAPLVRKRRPALQTAALLPRPRRGVSSAEQSSRHRDLLQNRLDDLADPEPFDFEFSAENQPVFEDWNGHGLDIVGRDEIAPAEGCQSAAGVQQALRRARAGANQHAFMLPRSADNIDEVADDILADRDADKLFAKCPDVFSAND